MQFLNLPLAGVLVLASALSPALAVNNDVLANPFASPSAKSTTAPTRMAAPQAAAAVASYYASSLSSVTTFNNFSKTGGVLST
ncbi:MAG: hypothetical protein HYZ45_09080, partial [Burkholderiales bacterium]|nr:hypothetical protein [Burkholderiales bacterium]